MISQLVKDFCSIWISFSKTKRKNFVVIIAGTTYTLWEVLLLTEDAVALIRTNLESKYNISKVEYLGQQRTTVAVYEVPSYLIDEIKAAYMLQYNEIVGTSHNGMRGE